VGFYVSGQLLTEDYYVFNKLAKGLIGTNNIDTNSRLCMSSAVAGYKATLGADAPPACYDDVNHAQCLFIVGSNAAWAHPILFRRIEDARAANPGMKVIVADPRRTDTAGMADLFLPIQPGSDVMLFHGMLHLMLWEGWTDAEYIAAHTTGFDELKALVREATPERVAQVCGISVADLTTAAKWFAGLDGQEVATGASGAPQRRKPTLSLYCQGLNQSSSGTAKNAALINLHLATGADRQARRGPLQPDRPAQRHGRARGGWHGQSAQRPPRSGQPAAPRRSGRAVGGGRCAQPARQDGGGDVPGRRRRRNQGPVDCLHQPRAEHARPGHRAPRAAAGRVCGGARGLCHRRNLRICRPAAARHHLGRKNRHRDQQRAPHLARAHCRLPPQPALSSMATHAAVTPVDEGGETAQSAALPMPPAHCTATGPGTTGRLACFLRSVWNLRLRPGQPTLFPYPTPEAVWNEHRESTRGRDLDITGLSYAMIDTHGPQQWPLPDNRPAISRQAEEHTVPFKGGEVRLYADGVFPTADGKARFAAVPHRPVAEARESKFPFSLTTGRLRDQWHGMSRTGTLGRLFGHVPEPTVHMHPQDMARRGFAQGDLVSVTSKRGTLVVPVQASDEVGLSQLFMAMHWGSEFLSGMGPDGLPLAGVNALTTSAHCPTSKQPEFKHAAVRVDKTNLPWTLLALGWVPDDRSPRGARSFARPDAPVCICHLCAVWP
jgi:assimilatory nitrate reductase catalytic subunit